MVNFYDQAIIDPIFKNVKTYVIDGSHPLDEITKDIKKIIDNDL